MRQNLSFSLWMVASFAIPIAIAGLFSIITNPNRSSQSVAIASPAVSCQTIIADPAPPLNVRSSPVATSDNAIGQLPNGTTLRIVDEDEGWLRINSPLQGWVYKELTVTSCGSLAEFAGSGHSTITNPSADRGTGLLAIATEQYHSGNLNGAIALAKTVPADSPAYQSATTAIIQWQQDWSRAESDFYSAQKAARDGKWQDVFSRVEKFPQIRFWKEKMAPLVKQAAEQIQLEETATPKK